MNNTRWVVAGTFVGVAIILVLGADVTTKMFDQTYFSTNQTAISLRGNITNWSKASTNLASFNGVTNTLGVTTTGLAVMQAADKAAGRTAIDAQLTSTNLNNWSLISTNITPSLSNILSRVAQFMNPTVYNLLVSGWNPTNIPGVQCYYVARNVTNTVDGSTLTNWPDVMGTYPLIAEPTPPVWVKHAMNGNPAVLFSGSAESMTNMTFPSDTKPFTIATVFYSTNDNGSQSFCSGASAGAAAQLDRYNTGVRLVKSGVASLATGTHLIDKKVHTLVVTYSSGGVCQFWLDGADYGRATNDTTFTGSLGLMIGNVPAHTFGFQGFIAEYLRTSTVMEDADRVNLEQLWLARYFSPVVNLVCDGNSMTHGYTGDTTYPTMLQTLLGTPWLVHNIGVDGQTTSNMLSDEILQVFPYAADHKSTVICWEGGNSIKTGSTALQAYNDLTNYCWQATTNGQKVIVATVMKRNDFNPTMEGYRVSLNTNLLATWTAFATGITDLAGDNRLDETVTPGNFHPDLIHPNDLGNAVVSELFRNTLLMLPSP